MTVSQNIKPDRTENGHFMEDELYEAIRAMPKIELHRHLEGSVRLETLVDIARDYEIDVPLDVEELRPLVQVMPDEPRTFQNFLSKFGVLRHFFASTDIIYRITREAIVDAANDNVKYLELRFTPKALSNIVGCSSHEAVNIVCQTAESTAEEYGIMVRLIVSPNRHESVEIAAEAAEAAIDHRHMGVVALDVGGSEPGNPVYPFRQIFKRARAAGLRTTVHAGEWVGPESIWDAISNVNTDRIGHGIRVLEDEGIANILIDRGIVLEVCPSSNVDTGSHSTDLSTHPLPRLIDRGLQVTINTDDPLLFNISLTDELFRTVKHMALTLDDLKQHTILAAQSAFLPDSQRMALVKQFTEWLYP